MSASSKIPTAATETGRFQTDEDRAKRDGFRPVALPALAAACRRAPSAKAMTVKAGERAAGERRGILEMVHEDAPIL